MPILEERVDDVLVADAVSFNGSRRDYVVESVEPSTDSNVLTTSALLVLYQGGRSISMIAS